jgi:NADH-quinone oxidoreductase subunit J
MQITLILFYLFGGVAAIAAIFVALTKNVIYAAFALVLCFIALAGVYVFLGAEFIGVTQILVYVGGVLVLLVFGVMLTNRVKGDKMLTLSQNKVVGFLMSVSLFILIYRGIMEANFASLEWVNQDKSSQVGLKGFGLNLMTEYVLAFEMIGILLLVALLGAVYISGKKRKEYDAS